MEHKTVTTWAESHGMRIDEVCAGRLCRYAEMVSESGSKFNITGHETRDKILKDLVLGSLEPLAGLNVPRGTCFADIGTGAGVPGVPLGIVFPWMKGVLIDSSKRKTMFLKKVIRELGLGNLDVKCMRIEDAGRDKGMREGFGYVFARALGGVYLSLELGAPLVSQSGMFFMFSRLVNGDLQEEVISHGLRLGMTAAEGGEGLPDCGNGGVIFRKDRNTPPEFPRRYSVIKRDSERISRPGGAG